MWSTGGGQHSSSKMQSPDRHKALAFALECEQAEKHTTAVILPTRPAMPQHKYKIESRINYGQKNAFKGRTFESLGAEIFELGALFRPEQRSLAFICGTWIKGARR